MNSKYFDSLLSVLIVQLVFSRKGTLIKNLEVVTSMKSKANIIHKFAASEKLLVHKWPYAVPEEKFDIGIVVSFGYLIPESVIRKFPLLVFLLFLKHTDQKS